VYTGTLFASVLCGRGDASDEKVFQGERNVDVGSW